MAGFSRKIGSRSAPASLSASSEPNRSSRASGPEKAFCTETCWSSRKPISSAIGLEAISRLASSDSVKWSWAGTQSILDRRERAAAFSDFARDEPPAEMLGDLLGLLQHPLSALAVLGLA